MTIGVLGGGQLGRMMALAGYTLGQRFVFLDPGAESSAGHVGNLRVGAYDDEERLSELARKSDVVTYEFENVPVGSARFLNELVRVYPPPRALEVSQDRLDEKRFFASLGIPTAGFAAVSSKEELERAVARLGLPAVLKTRRFGYDGKGQWVLRTAEDVDARMGGARRRVARARGVRAVRARDVDPRRAQHARARRASSRSSRTSIAAASCVSRIRRATHGPPISRRAPRRTRRACSRSSTTSACSRSSCS